MPQKSVRKIYPGSLLAKHHFFQQKRVHFYDSNKVDVSKNRGKTPKMDGENNGKTLLKWMISGFPNPLFFGNIQVMFHFYDSN